MIYDVVTPVPRPGKPANEPGWHTIGRAWSDSEDKICIVLDSIPFRSEYVYLLKAKDQDRFKRPAGKPVTSPSADKHLDEFLAASELAAKP